MSTAAREERKTLAVFGAGPGLGMSLARRFGREGYTVALLARSAERLRSFTGDLASAGITAHAVPADLADLDAIPDTVARVEAAVGPIDVAAVSPVGRADLVTRTLDVDAGNLVKALGPILYAPVQLVRALYPPMVERGTGAIVVAGGTSAIHPVAVLGSAGIGGAGLRNHLYSLHTELAPHGVYVGTVPIGGLIDRSDVHRLLTENPSAFESLLVSSEDAFPEGTFDILDPDRIADVYWELVTKRDRVEEVVGSPLA